MILAPDLGHRRAPWSSVEQFSPERRLDTTDAAAYDGLSDTKTFGCIRDAPTLDDTSK